MHPGGVRSDTHLFYFEKSANLKHPIVHTLYFQVFPFLFHIHQLSNNTRVPLTKEWTGASFLFTVQKYRMYNLCCKSNLNLFGIFVLVCILNEPDQGQGNIIQNICTVNCQTFMSNHCYDPWVSTPQSVPELPVIELWIVCHHLAFWIRVLNSYNDWPKHVHFINVSHTEFAD